MVLPVVVAIHRQSLVVFVFVADVLAVFAGAIVAVLLSTFVVDQRLYLVVNAAVASFAALVTVIDVEIVVASWWIVVAIEVVVT